MAEHDISVAILASGDRQTGGGGSTMERFIEDTQERTDIGIEVGLVITNNPRVTDKPDDVRGVYDRVDDLNAKYGLDIPVLKINGRTHPQGQQERGQTLEEASAIAEEIAERGIWFVMCLGYMKQANGELVEEYGWQSSFTEHDVTHSGIYFARMANTHPGILPATRDTHGIGASQKAIADGLDQTAHTLHLVSAGIDDGPVIAENKVAIRSGETAEDLFARVQDVEKANITTDVDMHLKQQAEFLSATAFGTILNE